MEKFRAQPRSNLCSGSGLHTRVDKLAKTKKQKKTKKKQETNNYEPFYCYVIALALRFQVDWYAQ